MESAKIGNVPIFKTANTIVVFKNLIENSLKLKQKIIIFKLDLENK